MLISSSVLVRDRHRQLDIHQQSDAETRNTPSLMFEARDIGA